MKVTCCHFPSILLVDQMLQLSEEFSLYAILCQDSNKRGQECAYCIARMGRPDVARFSIVSLLQCIPEIKQKIRCVVLGITLEAVEQIKEVLPEAEVLLCREQVLQTLYARTLGMKELSRETAKNYLQALANASTRATYDYYLSVLANLAPEGFRSYYQENWHSRKEMWVSCWAPEKAREANDVNHTQAHVEKLSGQLTVPCSVAKCVETLLSNMFAGATKEAGGPRFQVVQSTVPLFSGGAVHRPPLFRWCSPPSPPPHSQASEVGATQELGNQEFQSWTEFCSFLDGWCRRQRQFFRIATSELLSTFKHTAVPVGLPVIERLKYYSVKMQCASTNRKGGKKESCPAYIRLKVGPMIDRLVIIKTCLEHNHELSDAEFKCCFRQRTQQSSSGLPVRVTNHIAKRFAEPDTVTRLIAYCRSSDWEVRDILHQLEALFKADPNAQVKLVFPQDQATFESLFFTTTAMKAMCRRYPRVLHIDRMLQLSKEFSLYAILCEDCNRRGRECAYCIARTGRPDVARFFVVSLLQCVPDIKQKIECVVLGMTLQGLEDIREVLPDVEVLLCREEVLQALYVKTLEMEESIGETVRSCLHNLANADLPMAYSYYLSVLVSLAPDSFVLYYQDNCHSRKEMWVSCWAPERARGVNDVNLIQAHLHKLSPYLALPCSVADCVKALLTVHTLWADASWLSEGKVSAGYRDICLPQAAELVEDELGAAKSDFYNLRAQEGGGFEINDGVGVFTVNQAQTSCSCSIYCSIALPCRHILAARLWTGEPLFDRTLVPKRWRSEEDCMGQADAESPLKVYMMPLCTVPLPQQNGSKMDENSPLPQGAV
uniref:SWIM-type domain-containing protein n=1 Tax=Latimeria chalumnae TaxID=7897 RepID=H3AMU2_LATCH